MPGMMGTGWGNDPAREGVGNPDRFQFSSATYGSYSVRLKGINLVTVSEENFVRASSNSDFLVSTESLSNEDSDVLLLTNSTSQSVSLKVYGVIPVWDYQLIDTN